MSGYGPAHTALAIGRRAHAESSTLCGKQMKSRNHPVSEQPVAFHVSAPSLPWCSPCFMPRPPPVGQLPGSSGPFPLQALHRSPCRSPPITTIMQLLARAIRGHNCRRVYSLAPALRTAAACRMYGGASAHRAVRGSVHVRKHGTLKLI